MIRGSNEDGCRAVHWLHLNGRPEVLCNGVDSSRARHTDDIFEMTCQACSHFLGSNWARERLISRRNAERRIAP